MTAERQLIVMRHAKAGELPGRPDIERPLRPRGCKNASAAGRWLADCGLTPDLVLCSSAKRAKQTWHYVSAELAGKPDVITEPRLYAAAATDLLAIFAEVEPAVRSLMYVGHNPAAADVTEIITGAPVGFPTSGIAIVGVTVPWQELATTGTDGHATLVASWQPRA